ncbi:MAG: Lrp/AsnC ligand binding domain-containing protein [Promethearchaeota archaeon]|jgi:anthranilate phosphoribosyltransferase
MRAIILCKLGINVIKKVIEELKAIPEIKKVMSLTGDYDLMAEIEVETSEQLFDIFSEKIDLIQGITVSNTHVIMKSWEK